MGSRRYPGRRHVKGWQLTAVVGAVGALAVAGCGSSGTSTSTGTGSTSSSTALPAGGASSAPGRAYAGLSPTSAIT